MINDEHKFIAGAGGGGKSGSSSGHTATEDPDTLQSRAMVSVLDLIGEGQIGGLVDGAKSVYLGDLPLMNSDNTYNFKGVSWEMRNGTQDQTPIKVSAVSKRRITPARRSKTPRHSRSLSQTRTRIRCAASLRCRR